jgi:hypothetical protein
MTGYNPQFEFALQIFNGREYETVVTSTERKALDVPMIESAALGRPRRIVRVDKARPAKPVYRYTREACSRKGDRDAETICNEYMEWAKAHGLTTVTVFADGPWHGRTAAVKHGMEVRAVRVADFLGSTQPEVEEIAA